MDRIIVITIFFSSFRRMALLLYSIRNEGRLYIYKLRPPPEAGTENMTQ